MQVKSEMPHNAGNGLKLVAGGGLRKNHSLRFHGTVVTYTI